LSGAGFGAQSIGQGESGDLGTGAVTVSRHIVQFPTARGSTAIPGLQISKADFPGGRIRTKQTLPALSSLPARDHRSGEKC